jgi:hypothetical protein
MLDGLAFLIGLPRAVRMTHIVDLVHTSLIGFRVRILHLDEGDDDQAHEHFLNVHKDLFFELDDAVRRIFQEEAFHHEEV